MYNIKHKSKGLISHGVSACAGCGLEMILRNVLEVLGQDTISVNPPGCIALFAGLGKDTGLKIAGMMGCLENTAACASGIRAGLNAQGNTHTNVLGIAGDGGTADIGLQALSGAIERRDRIIYVCYDNEAYMNTGIQGSSLTPLWASTTTTPGGKPVTRKNLIGIAMAHDIPYAATASLQNLADLRKKVKKAMETNGPSLLHIHCPCPTGWFYDPKYTIRLAKLAVTTGNWILYEYEDGKVTINYKPQQLEPVDEYLKLQGRFEHLKPEQLEQIKGEIKKTFDRFVEKNS